MEKLSWRQQILSFKSENGFCDAVNNGTLTPIRTVQLAELVGKSHAEPVDFLTDGAIGTGMVNEDGVAYTKSLAKATDPHDLAFGKHLPCLLVNECAPLGRSRHCRCQEKWME